MPPAWISTSEYAEHRGIAARSVRQAIEEGRLRASVRRSGRFYEINVTQADREWAASTDPLRGGKRQAGNMAADYAEARRRRTIIEANLVTLELAEREAQLVASGAVERERRRVALELEAQLMRLPDRLAPVIVAEADAFKVHAIMTAAFREVLRRLSTEG